MTHDKSCVHLHVLARHMASHESPCMEGSKWINVMFVEGGEGRKGKDKEKGKGRKGKEKGRKGKEKWRKEEKRKEENRRKRRNKEKEGVSRSEQTRMAKVPKLRYER